MARKQITTGKKGKCVDKVKRHDAFFAIDMAEFNEKFIKERMKIKEIDAVNVKPVFEYFREFFSGSIPSEKIEEMINSFLTPPAKYSAIVRLGGMLENMGIPSDQWIEEASNHFLTNRL